MPFLITMGLSLKLEVKPNNYVLVTNLQTKEQIEVTFDFIQKATKSSLSMLAQYKCYELILEAEKHWKNISKFQSGKEAETLRAIKLDELEEIANIRSNVRRQITKETVAKQQRWDEIAAYNKAQRYNRLSMAIQYADYCLEHDYRYNFKAIINRNTKIEINQNLSKDEQIIALKRENKALRDKIAELEAGHINSASFLDTEVSDYILGEIVN